MTTRNAMPADGQKLLSARKIAKRCGVSHQTIINWLDKGKLPSVDVSKGKRRHRRVTEAALAAFLNTPA